ncbi:Sorting nexin-18 [Araneus ventricosus]|uniref:Sorting nexin-18 n=1 Tax=Araneus ventricosus TaxID=182803 RepID=A0A4Y2L3Q9_ARAVE|nr:Sorting nexin-18 [Araneus ventricosus]
MHKDADHKFFGHLMYRDSYFVANYRTLFTPLINCSPFYAKSLICSSRAVRCLRITPTNLPYSATFCANVDPYRNFLHHHSGPRNDLEPFGDILHEYKGILASWPEIVQIQKGATQKKKEHQKLMEEGKLPQESVMAIARRTDIISYAVLAEITHFQQEQVGEFKNMIQNFLQEQVKFYLQIAEKLQSALDLYDT